MAAALAPPVPVASKCVRDASFSSAACAAVPAARASVHGSSGRMSSMWGSNMHIAERKVASQAATSTRKCQLSARAEAAQATVASPSGRIIHGKCFVLGDNIDTDQIIPAEYLTLVPSKPEEYEKLGSYAMAGLPATYGKFMQEGNSKTEYKVIIGGANFGCGSSREHAPVALGAAGVRAVVAESYARIFFRNSVATGELYPVEANARICDDFKTGEIVTVDLEHDLLVNHTTGKQYNLQPIGEAGPVIDAGGLFEFARKTGMIAAKA